MIQSECMCGGGNHGSQGRGLRKAVVMSLLGLVKQPARHNRRMVTLRKFKSLVGVPALDATDLQDYRDTSIVEDLWSKLGMPESLPLVPGE